MQRAQEELASLEVTGQAGGGLVSVVMSGRHEVRRVTIDRKLFAEDAEMAEDLVAAAFNDAVNRIASRNAGAHERHDGRPQPAAQVQDAI